MSSSKSVLDTVREWTVSRRFLSIAIIIGAVAAIALTATILLRPTFAPLFTSLSSEDAAAVVEKLEADGTKYQLENGGSTILVPKDDVAKARMSAAADGLPTSSSGSYSLLDTLGATASKFQQDTALQRSLQDRIAESIQTLDSVDEATVTFTVPEETVFVAEKESPTATVIIRTRQGQTLDDDQVNSILHIVAGSIKGMDRNNIAITDTSGRTLSEIGGNSDATASKKAAEHENRISKSISKILDQVVGSGNATVSVVAEMSVESAEQVSESFGRPENGTQPLTEATETEEYEGTGGANGGVLGTDNVTTGGGTNGEGTYKSEKTDRKNAVNKVTENRVVPAGQLQRQTISVVIDQNAAPNLNQDDITAAITNAAGVDAERGDQLTVRLMPFDTTAAERLAAELEASKAAEAEAQKAEMVKNGIIGGSILLGAIILSVILFVLMRKRRKQGEEGADVAPVETQMIAAPVAPLPELEDDDLYADSMLGTTALPVQDAPAEEPQVNVYLENIDDIKRFVEQDPKAVSQHMMGLIAKDGK